MESSYFRHVPNVENNFHSVCLFRQLPFCGMDSQVGASLNTSVFLMSLSILLILVIFALIKITRLIYHSYFNSNRLP